METALPHHHRRFLPWRAAYTSTPANHVGARIHVGLPMRLSFRGDLTLKRASAYPTIVNSYRFPDPPKSFRVNTLKRMAEKSNDTREAMTKDTKEEKKEKALPPPPEKPEPGDCCGSGCVRCVWDVYYEELEAYNKLYKSDSDDSKSKAS